eukprot:14025-Eustigmatos_ZCMA.PRE.1
MEEWVFGFIWETIWECVDGREELKVGLHIDLEGRKPIVVGNEYYGYTLISACEAMCVSF